jgi:hypothetical protein
LLALAHVVPKRPKKELERDPSAGMQSLMDTIFREEVTMSAADALELVMLIATLTMLR